MFPNPEKLSPPLLKMEEGDFHYSEDKPIFKGINFGVDMDSRIAIVGANGVKFICIIFEYLNFLLIFINF
jgi:ATPase subunit of ABC transporter with duplicated ATPase domains